MASSVIIWSLLAIIFCTATSAENATIFNMTHVPDWQARSLMVFSITAPDGDALAIRYDVYPLTANVGLNGTDRDRMAVRIRGQFVSADTEDYVSQMDRGSVVYLNCDLDDSSNQINELMTNAAKRPSAILLYSLSGDCCGIEGTDLPYRSIFTMGSSIEAQDVLNYTHTGTGVATIMGTDNNTTPDGQPSPGGSNSAVAMSILYSITGLITLLFLIIIATGAIRAHRYPERYGPRSGHGGRPRQSRAKGLARAVLETLPIIKFGDPSPGKPDPALELEHQPSRSTHDPAIGTRLSAIPEEPKTPKTPAIPATIAEAPSGELSATGALGNNTTSTTDVNAVTHGPNDEHLGCPICTEDFTVGEDVRVLPCDHKFHPYCIDPWLVNISGTCPLCRLDLRPPCSEKEGAPASSGSDSVDGRHLADTNAQQPANERRRSSRLLDLHRLRHASVEERIEILRLHRTQSRQQQQPRDRTQAQTDPEDTDGHRARLTDRLRDKFKIRTTRRGESPGRGGRTE
ncbi:E3 ubiquitin-protein ligase SDIR1 [Rhypophila decipiens]|uniref:RING-type E3 ubiquitin transferase n=1 Tax=Rhypophila decipiens TaxID=261697 RepID=A0AAN6XWV0_9PEZI|nr:E3 ubiquitin-protein ligase SDIR1 [Rhypophila decipiens]